MSIDDSSVKSSKSEGKKGVLDMSCLGKRGAFHNDETIEAQLESGKKVKFKKCKKTAKNAWAGECNGSSMILVNRGDLVYGNMIDVESGMVYQFGADENGKTVTARHSSDFLENGDPIEVKVNESPVIQTQSSLPPGARLREPANGHRALYDDLGGNLDIMVVWTKLSECTNYYDLPADCTITTNTTENMRALVDEAIAMTNQAYVNSEVETELRLVHAYRHPDYVEGSTTDGDSVLDALNHITETSDGQMDDVHTLRDYYGADIVAMIVENTASGGRGWTGPRIDKMFSVTGRTAIPNYSFSHEVGHNIGLKHDRGTKNECGTNDGNYNYGWRDPSGTFRTIMAYNCGNATQCDSNPSASCARVPYFSSDTVPYTNGLPTGNADNDSARYINEKRAEIAAYKTLVPKCSVSTDCDDSNACTEDTCRADGTCGFTAVPFCCGNDLCEGGESPSNCAIDCTGLELETEFCSSCRIHYGNMFDVEAVQDIIITGLDIHVNAESSTDDFTVQVYTRPGSYTASTSGDGSGWTNVLSTPVSNPGTEDNRYRMSLPDFTNQVSIGAGTTQAFYVTLQSKRMLYSGDQTSGAVFKENSDLKVYVGAYTRSTLYDYSSSQDKGWNGVIRYDLIPTQAPSIMPSVSMSPSLSMKPSVSPSFSPSTSPVLTRRRKRKERRRRRKRSRDTVKL